MSLRPRLLATVAATLLTASAPVFAATPPAPVQTAAAHAALLRPWVDRWWLRGVWYEIAVHNGALVGTQGLSGGRPVYGEVLPDGRLRLIVTEYGESTPTEIEVTLASDGQNGFALSNHPSRGLSSGLFRRMGSRGSPDLSSYPDLHQRLAGVWTTPLGRMTFTLHRTGQLTGVIQGDVAYSLTVPSSEAGRPSGEWGDTDALPVRFNATTGAGEGGVLRVSLAADGRSLLVARDGRTQIGGRDSFVATRFGTAPSTPSPTDDTARPDLPAGYHYVDEAVRPMLGSWNYRGSRLTIEGRADGGVQGRLHGAGAAAGSSAGDLYGAVEQGQLRVRISDYVKLTEGVLRAGAGDYLELDALRDGKRITTFLRRTGDLGQIVWPTPQQLLEALRGDWRTPYGLLQIRGSSWVDLKGLFVDGPAQGQYFTAAYRDRNEVRGSDADALHFNWFYDAQRAYPVVDLSVSPDGRVLLARHPEGYAMSGAAHWRAEKVDPPAGTDLTRHATAVGGEPPSSPDNPPAPPAPPLPEPPTPVPPQLPAPDPLPTPQPPRPTDPLPQPPAPQPEPEPPVIEPAPPTPETPGSPSPRPPLPSPPPPPSTTPPSGAGSVPGSGGFQGISQTWDIQFEGARVERGSEIHVFVSVKNRSTADQSITPGTFIPNLSNQDGEVITSRSVYRASGDSQTEFRPTVPVGEAVRIRFIFRPAAGSAQPRSFTLESFGYRKLTFDVSGLRVESLAR